MCFLIVDSAVAAAGRLPWECQKCGSCCVVPMMAMFGRLCKHQDEETMLCKIYETRPEICRVKHAFGEDITIRVCERLKEQADAIRKR